MTGVEQLQRKILEKKSSGEFSLGVDSPTSDLVPTPQGGTAAHFDWRHSIKDLLSLLGVDNTLEARKQLATELGYVGPLDGSAEMNIWLHKAVLKQMAANGCEVPPTLIE